MRAARAYAEDVANGKFPATSTAADAHRDCADRAAAAARDRRRAGIVTLADAARADGRCIALVPTLGALHDGHAALIAAARARADLVIVSIFVNPLQFGANEDLSRYPRPFERDLALCAASGADVVLRTVAGRDGSADAQTSVDVGELTRPLRGASRRDISAASRRSSRGSFSRRSRTALFREGLPATAVIRRMTRDLGFDVDVIGVPTVRSRRLALSSRTAFLRARCAAKHSLVARSLWRRRWSLRASAGDVARARARAAGAGTPRHDRLRRVARSRFARSRRHRSTGRCWRWPCAFPAPVPRPLRPFA